MRETGKAYGKFPIEIASFPLSDVIDEYFAVQEAHYNESVLQMRLVEAGVLRALAIVLKGKPLPEPEAPEVKEQVQGKKVPDWWIEYKKANPQVTL